MEAAIRKGREPPQWYLDEPEQGDGDGFFLLAFRDLSTTRSFGMSAGPIPWDRIMQWASWKGLNGALTETLVEVIGAMDAAWLEWQRKQEKNG